MSWLEYLIEEAFRILLIDSQHLEAKFYYKFS